MALATFVPIDDSRVIEVVDREPANSSHLSNFYFGAPGHADPGPQAFKVNYPNGADTVAHFHDVPQFQVFFGGPGSYFRRSEIDPLMVHYADPYTLYGPFGSSNHLTFMTLRANGSKYRGLMPNNRADIPAGASHRHHELALGSWLTEPLPMKGTSMLREIVARDADGLSISSLEAGGDAAFVGPSPADSGGQYYVVVQGEAFDGTRRLPEMTVGFFEAESDAPNLVAGPDGCRIMVLQFGTA